MEESPYSFRKIRADPDHEAEMVGVLMKSGRMFRVISMTDYIVCNDQCRQLDEKSIPYTKL